jgi:hypothetical protein
MTGKKTDGTQFKRVRKELAEMLGYSGDPDKLPIDQTMRLDAVFSLKLSLDEMRGRLYRGEPIDVTEMRAVADTLERYLPKQPEPEPVLNPRDDPHGRLMKVIDAWIANHEAERAERAAERAAQGLDALPDTLEEAHAEIERLRVANPDALKFWAAPELPAPEGERAIDVPTSAIVPPSEQTGGRNLRTRPAVGPDDPKPPVTIDGKALPPGAQIVNGRIVPIPPQAKPGHVTEAQRQAVNANRALDHQIMNAPSRVAGEPAPSLGQETWRGHTWRFEPRFSR